MAKNIFTTIEITDTHIKLVQAKTLRHKRVLCACDIKPLNDFIDDELIRKLSEMTAFRGIDLRNLVIVIPRRLAILKQMRLPSQNEGEIKKMVALQLVGQIPYAVEDIIYDFQLLEKEPSGYMRVLVIIVHKEVSDRFLKICRAAGLHPERFVLSSFGILNWLNYQQEKLRIPPDEPVLVINVDVDHTEICFCHHQKLFFSRSVNYGARDLMADYKTGLVHQIDLSLKNYSKDNLGPAVKKILFVSAVTEASALKGQMEEMASIPVDFHSPLANILCQKNTNLGAIQSQAGLALTAGIGLLLSDPKGLSNLIPPQVHEIKQSKHRQVQWIKLIGLFLLTCILGLAIPGMEFLRKVSYLSMLKKEIEAMGPELERVNQKMQVVQAIQGNFKKRILMADLIRDLYGLTPPGVSFQSLSMDEKGRFVMRGYAQTSASVYSFQENLVKSPLFTAVNLEFATKRKIFNMEVTDFQITSEVSVRHD